MYNRYIPQNDGSYRRSRMPDNAVKREMPVQKTRTSHHQVQPCPTSQPNTPCPHPGGNDNPPFSGLPITNFLKKLLPRDFDTGDLMIVLLLLLMNGDCQEDQNWALLTLVMYLFL